MSIISDSSAKELTQIVFKTSKLTFTKLIRILKHWLKRDTVESLYGGSKIPLKQLSKMGKTSTVEKEFSKLELKVLEKCFDQCGVERWAVNKFDEDIYVVTFLDQKENEVEIAMKEYINQMDKKYSLESLQEKKKQIAPQKTQQKEKSMKL